MPYSRVTRTISGMDAIAYARGHGRGHNGMRNRNLYVVGINMLPDEIVPFEKQMQPFWNKADPRHIIQADRFIISFALEELNPDNPEDCLKALEIGCEFARTNTPDSQSAIFVQADGRGRKLHLHIITNDVRMSDYKGIDPRSYAHFHFSPVVDRICSKYFSLTRSELAPERVTQAVRGARLANEKIQAENAKEYQQAIEEGRHPKFKPKKYIWRDDLCERILLAAKGAYDLESFAQRLRLDGVELVPRRLKDGSYTYIHPATRTMPAHFVYELVDTGGFEPGRIPANLRARSHKLGANYQPEGVEKLFVKEGPEAQAAREDLRFLLDRAAKGPTDRKSAQVPEKPKEAPPAKPADPEVVRAKREAMKKIWPSFAEFMDWGTVKPKKIVDGQEEDDQEEMDRRTRLWRDAWNRFERWRSKMREWYEDNGKRLAPIFGRDKSGVIYVREENLLRQFDAFLIQMESERQRRRIEARREALEAELGRGLGDKDYTED